jgi:hypothetical protein
MKAALMSWMLKNDGAWRARSGATGGRRHPSACRVIGVLAERREAIQELSRRENLDSLDGA